jgi:hypothetical protein
MTDIEASARRLNVISSKYWIRSAIEKLRVENVAEDVIMEALFDLVFETSSDVTDELLVGFKHQGRK